MGSLRNGIVPDVVLLGGCDALDELHLAGPTRSELVRCWQDEVVEPSSAGITVSSQGDIIHKRRKSKTNSPLFPVGEQITFFTALRWFQPPMVEGK